MFLKKFAIENVTENMIVGESVYLKDMNAPLILKDTPLTDFHIEKMKQAGVRQIVILRLEKDPPEKKPPVIDDVLCEKTLNCLEDFYSIASGDNVNTPHLTQAVRELDSAVDELVANITRDRDAAISINDLKSYDEYTYHHSLCVAVLSVAIGQQLGLSDQQLSQIGRCAMVHDIGKTTVPIEIINKPAKLTDSEFAMVKDHSENGYDFLARTGVGDEEIRNGVRHHHEKFDGTGYPGGLKENDIPLFSRIISVADVYDALTSKRPYRQPLHPAEVMEIIMGGVSTQFDYDVVVSFVEKIEPYPVGCVIELSDGSAATVIDNTNTLRPIVELHEGKKELDLYNDMDGLRLIIKQVLE